MDKPQNIYCIEPPYLRGEPWVGETIETTRGSWSGGDDIRYTFSWEVASSESDDWQVVEYKNDEYFEIREEFQGCMLRSLVKAQNDHDTETEYSAPIGPVEYREGENPQESYELAVAAAATEQSDVAISSPSGSGAGAAAAAGGGAAGGALAVTGAAAFVMALSAIISLVITIVLLFFALSPAGALVVLGAKVFDLFGLGKDEGQTILAAIPEDVKKAFEENPELGETIKYTLDCSSLPPSERRPGENCVEGALYSGDSVAWSAVPPSRSWLVPVWKAAGRRYNVPWELIAAVNGGRTAFGMRYCGQSAGKGFYQISSGMWDVNAIGAGSSDRSENNQGLGQCWRAVPPARIDDGKRKELTSLSAIKREPRGNGPKVSRGDPWDPVDSSFAVASLLSRAGAFGKKDWKEYDGKGARNCTVSDSDGEFSYPPATPFSFGGYKLGPTSKNSIRIANIIYAVGKKLGANDLAMLAAFEAAVVESGMRNLNYGHWDSLGVFQQRPGAGWGTPKQITNVTYAATAFFKGNPSSSSPVGAIKLSKGWKGSAGQLAQKVQVSAFPERYDEEKKTAIAWLEKIGKTISLNGAPPAAKNPYPYKGPPQKDAISGAVREAAGGASSCYVAYIKEWYTLIKKYPPVAPVGEMPEGITKLYKPRAFLPVPKKYRSCTNCTVDARILPNLIFLMETYDMVLTQGRAGYPPSQSHGDGLGVDLVPGPGGSWKKVEAASLLLGWRARCGEVGSAPACPLNPAIRWIGYNGASGHGDPAHAGGSAHLHIGWNSSFTGGYNGQLMPPHKWVIVFGSKQVQGAKGQEARSASSAQITPGEGRVVKGGVSWFNDASTASGLSGYQPGIALNLDKGSYRGWENPTTRKWMRAAGKGRPYCALVVIKGRSAVLPIIDKGPSIPGRSIDLTKEAAIKMGWKNLQKFPTDAPGKAQIIGQGRKGKCV